MISLCDRCREASNHSAVRTGSAGPKGTSTLLLGEHSRRAARADRRGRANPLASGSARGRVVSTPFTIGQEPWVRAGQKWSSSFAIGETGRLVGCGIDGDRVRGPYRPLEDEKGISLPSQASANWPHSPAHRGLSCRNGQEAVAKDGLQLSTGWNLAGMFNLAHAVSRTAAP